MVRKFDRRPLTPVELVERFSREGFTELEEVQKLLETESFALVTEYFDASKKLARLTLSEPKICHLRFSIDFDRGFRKALFWSLERIESLFRNALFETMHEELGFTVEASHWFLNDSCFDPNKLKTAKIFREAIAKEYARQKSHPGTSDYSEYYSAFDEPPYPPAWIVKHSAVTTFWTLEKLFTSLNHRHAEKVVTRFGAKIESNGRTSLLERHILKSWLISFYTLRNKCVHWMPTWCFVRHPKISVPDGFSLFEGISARSTYKPLLIVRLMEKSVDPARITSLREELLNLKEQYSDYSEIAFRMMGFPKRWQNLLQWRDRN